MPKFNITTPSGQSVQVEATDHFSAMDQVLGQTGPDVSALGSFGRGALSMLPLGNQAYAGVAALGQNEPYNQERQELTQEQAQDKEVNPGATYAGKAAGLIAPIAATAGLAAPETLLGAAGQGALVGGAFGAGNAVDTLASGGSGTKAAGDVALGAGLGAAGGAAGEALTGLLGEGASALKNSDIGQRLQAENVSKALGLAPGALKALGKESGSTPEAAVQQIYSDIQDLPGLPENFVHPTGSVNEKLGMLQAIKQKAGEGIGAVRKAAGAATENDFPEGAAAIKDLAAQAEDNIGLPGEGMIKGAATNLQAMAARGKLDFDQMSNLRSSIGEAVHSDLPGAHQVYKTLSQHLDNALDRMGDVPGIDKTAFQAAKKAYATTSKVIPLMQRGAGREASGTGGGLSNLLGIGGTLMGHPTAAIAPVAHEVQKIAAPEMIHNIMLGGLGSTPKAVAGALPQMGAQAAASQVPGVDKQRAVNDFVMSQRSPTAAKQASDNAAHVRENPTVEQPKNMANGGFVSDTIDKIKNYQGSPAFGSTLPGLEIMARKAAGDNEPATPVRTAAPEGTFNPQMAEQLRAYISGLKDKQNENE